ncbi:MAG: DUF512 domain-containing protein [Ruminococcaceae bacterium]|nr:DUF512 domain-containing protein [Oscillospiraceae bacterium]
MAVLIKDVEQNSPAKMAGIKGGNTLLTINGEEIVDVLDYRFYQENENLTVGFIDANGKIKQVNIQKDEFEELGLIFDTYLMDKQRSCKNKCMFCFIDQLPRGLRQSLYFKDDDSRLSFLFGNYITLTNITEHEVERIIKMHISPINVSVHTTDPELRVKMMTNKNAGKALELLSRFDKAGIRLNCQLVLCPGINDGAALEKSLDDLTKLENIGSVAAVPVGLTRYRENLAKLEPFNRETAAAVVDIIERVGEECIKRFGERKVYASDEFYLLAEREIPPASFYGDFLQLENGVGLWALLKSEAMAAIEENDDEYEGSRRVTIATGEAAYPLISEIARLCNKKWDVLDCRVVEIKNNFFGGHITVSGLVTATDIYQQLRNTDIGEELLIPSSMLRSEGDMFLDSITLEQLEEKLNVKITPVDNDGWLLVDRILGI